MRLDREHEHFDSCCQMVTTPRSSYDLDFLGIRTYACIYAFFNMCERRFEHFTKTGPRGPASCLF